MKKSIWIINWLLILIFGLMIVSNFINFPFANAIKPIFIILIAVHITQHWKVIVNSLKLLKKSKKDSSKY